MKIPRRLPILFISVLFPLLLGGYIAAKSQKKEEKKSVCSAKNPQGICNASTTCGSSSTPCALDVKRTDYAASVTSNIPDAKENAPFCVKAGTTVTWQSSSKNTGFIVDFGEATPFGSQTAIIGGSDRSVSVLAKKPGCYKYSVGACKAGATYGMCDSADAEFVVTAGDN